MARTHTPRALGKKPGPRNDPDNPLTLAVIEELKNQGLNQSQIAAKFGVTRQAVSWHRRHYNGKLTPREELLEAHFPWQVSGSQLMASPYRQLRDHGELYATGGVGMPETKLNRVRCLHNKLRKNNAVLEYDPSIQPQPGFCLYGGFALRPRTPEDGDLMIRVNEFTRLTEEGRKIWRLPSMGSGSSPHTGER